jgi:hypothetical protein
MMAWTDPFVWLAQHTPIAALTGREADDDDEREQTQRALERAHQTVDAWEEQSQMWRALRWERRFWEHSKDQGRG